MKEHHTSVRQHEQPGAQLGAQRAEDTKTAILDTTAVEAPHGEIAIARFSGGGSVVELDSIRHRPLPIQRTNYINEKNVQSAYIAQYFLALCTPDQISSHVLRILQK